MMMIKIEEEEQGEWLWLVGKTEGGLRVGGVSLWSPHE